MVMLGHQIWLLFTHELCDISTSENVFVVLWVGILWVWCLVPKALLNLIIETKKLMFIYRGCHWICHIPCANFSCSRTWSKHVRIVQSHWCLDKGTSVFLFFFKWYMTRQALVCSLKCYFYTCSWQWSLGRLSHCNSWLRLLGVM